MYFIPYTSEHNTGLAIDYIIKVDGNFLENLSDYESLEESIYINNNAHKYGFIVRYPKEKESITECYYEPWHLRYVGTE